MVKRISIGLCWVLLATSVNQAAGQGRSTVEPARTPTANKDPDYQALFGEVPKDRFETAVTEAFGYIGNYDRLHVWARSRCTEITGFLKEDYHA